MPKPTAAKTRKTRVPRKRKPQTAGLAPADCASEITGDLTPIADRVRKEGGLVVAAYRDPLRRHPLLLAVLPIDGIQPTPFPRDLTEAHHNRLLVVLTQTR